MVGSAALVVVSRASIIHPWWRENPQWLLLRNLHPLVYTILLSYDWNDPLEQVHSPWLPIRPEFPSQFDHGWTHSWDQIITPCLLQVILHSLGDSSSTTNGPIKTLVLCHPVWTWSKSRQHPWHLFNKCCTAALRNWVGLPPIQTQHFFSLSFHTSI